MRPVYTVFGKGATIFLPLTIRQMLTDFEILFMAAL